MSKDMGAICQFMEQAEMFEGAFEVIGRHALGWARKPDSGEPLWVEVLADDTSMGIARADLPEPKGCGFIIEIPLPVIEEGSKLLMRIANTNAYLKQIATTKANESDKKLCGEIIVHGALTFSGWALDPREPEKKLTISAHHKGEKIAEAVANLGQYSPPEADGHGFVLHLPLDFADGERKLLNFLDADNRELPGSPVVSVATVPSVSIWCRQNKQLEGPARELLANMLANVERMLPDVTASSNFASWKRAFPPPAPAGKVKFSIYAPFLSEKELANALKWQRGIECRIDPENYDLALIMQPGDRLHPHALALLAQTLRDQDAAIAYADGENTAGMPLLKSAWDRHAFLGHDYLGPFVASGRLVRQTVPRSGESIEAFRLRLACGCQMPVAHLPQLLSQEFPHKDHAKRLAALRQWLEQTAPGSKADMIREDLYEVHYGLARKPGVTLIIPTRDRADLLSRCLQSLEKTDWPDLQCIIVDNGSVTDDAKTLLANVADRENFLVLRDDGIFNYARLNNLAARHARGELICLLNNDTEILSENWLAELAAPLLIEGDQAGCAGAKLLWPNGLVQHGGVVTGIMQLAAHVGNRWRDDEPGYMGRNIVTRQYSAVTGACLLTPKKLFLDTGGLDAGAFAVNFNDVDYCLRLRKMGKKIVWTPNARLLHHESASRGKDETKAARARANREIYFFRARWGSYEDPFHNPNLPLCASMEPFYGLAIPPRSRKARVQNP